jgi:hypothetical protein
MPAALQGPYGHDDHRDMPYTRTDMFLAAKRVLRVHPGWTDEQVAEHTGIPAVLIDETIGPARREVDQDRDYRPGVLPPGG